MQVIVRDELVFSGLHIGKRILQLRCLCRVNHLDFLIQQACVLKKYRYCLVYNFVFLTEVLNAKSPMQPFESKCSMVGTVNLSNAHPMPREIGRLGLDRAVSPCLFLMLL